MMLFEKMAAQDRQILEHAQTECQERHIVEIDAKAIADIDEEGRHQGIHEKARNEHGIVEMVL